MYYLNRVKWAVVLLALGLALWCTFYFTAKTKQLMKQDEANTLFELAAAAYENQSYQEAVHLLNQAINIDTTNAQAYYQRALAHSRLDDYPNCYHDMVASSRLGFNLATNWLNEHDHPHP